MFIHIHFRVNLSNYIPRAPSSNVNGLFKHCEDGVCRSVFVDSQFHLSLSR